MTGFQRKWTTDAVDAIYLRSTDCKLDIQGTLDASIEIRGDIDERFADDLKISAAGKTLSIYVPSHYGHSQLAVRLPQTKPIVLTVFSGKGEITARGIQSRLRIILGRGELRLEDCKGNISTGSGHANVTIKNFIQTDVPAAPATPSEPGNGTPNGPRIDWFRWGEDDWENWGIGLGEKIGWWALEMGRTIESHGFFNRLGIAEQDMGLNMESGNGNADIQNIQVKACRLKLGRGNLKLDNAPVKNMEITIGHGNIEVKSAIPYGDWLVKTIHGNIDLSIPSNSSARLDMSTRNGNIESEIPMVQVTHQGPESHSGRRMVGTIGATAEGTVPEMRITTIHGNIKIKSDPPAERKTEFAGKPAPARETTTVAPRENTVKPNTNSFIGAPRNIAPGERATCSKDEVQLEILTALKDGKISVEEADKLLQV